MTFISKFRHEKINLVFLGLKFNLYKINLFQYVTNKANVVMYSIHIIIASQDIENFKHIS